MRRPLLLLPVAAALGLGLGGCATQSFAMRTLPDETPAADTERAIRRSEGLQAARQAAPAPDNPAAMASSTIQRPAPRMPITA